MSTLDDLIAQFEKFPGVGARQAKRFAFHVLTLAKADADSLAHNISSLQSNMMECTLCHRFVSQTASGSLCSICADTTRDTTKLLVVAQDSDIISIERSGVYDGLYFVLGGTVPLLQNDNTKRLRGNALKATVSERIKTGLKEVILGFAVNPDGENTARYVEKLITDLRAESTAPRDTSASPSPRSDLGLGDELTVSYLGRGLSTGSELEYADPETLKNALQNRQ